MKVREIGNIWTETVNQKKKNKNVQRFRRVNILKWAKFAWKKQRKTDEMSEPTKSREKRRRHDDGKTSINFTLCKYTLRVEVIASLYYNVMLW